MSYTAIAYPFKKRKGWCLLKKIISVFRERNKSGGRVFSVFREMAVGFYVLLLLSVLCIIALTVAMLFL